MATQTIEKERMKSLRLFKYLSPRICQNTLFSTLGSELLCSMKILKHKLTHNLVCIFIALTPIFFWQRLIDKGKNSRLLSSLKICAIGPATAKELKKKGIGVDYVPKKFVAESILQGFRKMMIQGKRILLARAKVARDILPKGLRKMGAEVDVVEAYRTLKPRGGKKRLKQLFTDEKMDIITFTSSSTVNHFAELLKEDDLKILLRGITIACIGPITAQTAKKWGMRVQIQPRQYTIPALTRAIARYFAQN